MASGEKQDDRKQAVSGRPAAWTQPRAPTRRSAAGGGTSPCSASACSPSFAYGLSAGKYRLSPTTRSTAPWTHCATARELAALPAGPLALSPADRPRRRRRDRARPGHRRARPRLPDLLPRRPLRASLVDREGRSLHAWDVAFSDVFPAPEHLEAVPPDFDVSIRGTELLTATSSSAGAGGRGPDRPLLAGPVGPPGNDPPRARPPPRRRHIDGRPA